MTDLKPCPFCGGAAMRTLTPVGFVIRCRCGVDTHTHKTVDAAEATWNTRAAIEAPVQEPVAEVVRDVWGRCERLEDEAYSKLEKSTELTEHELGFWRGQKTTAKQIRRATEMPATPQPDETAALRAELNEVRQSEHGLMGRLETCRQDEAKLRAKLAEVERERDDAIKGMTLIGAEALSLRADRDEERKLADDLAYSLKAANHYLRKAGYTPYTEATDRHAARRKEQRG